MNCKSIFLTLALSITAYAPTFAQIQRLEKETEECFNFLISSDNGRNGYYKQKTIAETMGKLAETVDVEFMVGVGDIHHFGGVESTADPLWMTNFETIYSHPELMIDWYSVLGNHEYRGNTEAVLDYCNVSRRWRQEARYYTQLHELDGGQTLRLIYLDTSPLISKYRKDKAKYKDASSQDMQAQITWLEKVLKDNKATWTVAFGHHPIYAHTTKKQSERLDMQRSIDPLLRQYNVDFYICGHIHNFQHIRSPKSTIDYVVNSSASLSREVHTTDEANPANGLRFGSGEAGFTLFSTGGNSATLYLLDGDANILHTVKREKK